MKQSFLILLAALVVFGSYPAEALSAPMKNDDCVMCGHVCCCPEICDQKISSCKIESKDSAAGIFIQERVAVKKPVSWLISANRPNDGSVEQSIQSNPILFLTSPIPEVLTPPPNSFPA